MTNISADSLPEAVRLVEPSGSADPYHAMDLLRLTTAGSVDDGKSTLIGRLLYDTKSIFQDQLEAIEGASRRRGEEGVNLALLTDGLRAEREQNITIDVAYRYFSTPRRKFIIADTPGHVQYTRNMVTGASTAELAIVLVDARKGVLTQSRRHGFISSLLGIPHIVVAVNKMDLVGFDEETYDRIVTDYTSFATKLDTKDLTFIPISALHGDNIVEHSANMPWYEGSTLLHHLESVKVGTSRNMIDFRFPVQYTIRPHQDFRGFAGRIASGTISPGEDVIVLPSGQATTVRSVETGDGPVDEASAGESVALTLEHEIDIARGDMIVRRMNVPSVEKRVDATVCWLAEKALDPAMSYVLLHTTRTTRALVKRIVYRIDVDTLHREEVETLGLNDIGRIEIESAQPIFFDPYQINPGTGSFLLVDPFTNVTVAAGMIRGAVSAYDAPKAPDAEAAPPRRFAPGGNDAAAAPPAALRAAVPPNAGGDGSAERGKSPDVVWEEWNVGRAEREARNGHRAAVVWLTGLSGAGKSTIARGVERALFERGCQTMLLDGDQLRHGLCGDLGFSNDDRAENIRRAGEVARLFFEQGSVVLCSFVSPFTRERDAVRALLPEGAFFEVHVTAALDTLKSRDTKGLYARAAAGEVALTGVNAPYEAPTSPDIEIDTSEVSVEAAVGRILEALRAAGIIDRV